MGGLVWWVDNQWVGSHGGCVISGWADPLPVWWGGNQGLGW